MHVDKVAEGHVLQSWDVKFDVRKSTEREKKKKERSMKSIEML